MNSVVQKAISSSLLKNENLKVGNAKAATVSSKRCSTLVLANRYGTVQRNAKKMTTVSMKRTALPKTELSKAYLRLAKAAKV